MGYCIWQHSSSFIILAENFAKVVKAIKEAFKDQQFGWVRAELVQNCKSIFDILAECRWDVDIDIGGNIVGIEFTGEKLGDDIETLFNAIAPYVQAGSYIQMSGEEGEQWKYVFDGASMREVQGRVVFDD